MGMEIFHPNIRICARLSDRLTRTGLNGPRPENEFWVVPELGPKSGYGLSSFPCIWEDAVTLGRDLEKLWFEVIEAID